jgi:hypothetical protein
MRKARYRGRTKTLFQAALTAAVANLTLIAGKSEGPEPGALLFAATKLAWQVLSGALGGPPRTVVVRTRLQVSYQPQLGRAGPHSVLTTGFPARSLGRR